MVSKSMTLDNLERHVRTLLHKLRAVN